MNELNSLYIVETELTLKQVLEQRGLPATLNRMILERLLQETKQKEQTELTESVAKRESEEKEDVAMVENIHED